MEQDQTPPLAKALAQLVLAQQAPALTMGALSSASTSPVPALENAAGQQALEDGSDSDSAEPDCRGNYDVVAVPTKQPPLAVAAPTAAALSPAVAVSSAPLVGNNPLAVQSTAVTRNPPPRKRRGVEALQ